VLDRDDRLRSGNLFLAALYISVENRTIETVTARSGKKTAASMGTEAGVLLAHFVA